MKLAILVAAVAAAPASVQAGVHPPEIEARLEWLVGDWTSAGPEATYRETCDWYRDRAFVVCASEDKSDNSLSQSIIGYSKADGHFTYYNFSSRGTSQSETGEEWLTYRSERRGRDGNVRSTIHATPEAGVHPPEIEARLAAIVGDWTIAGQEATYRETCDWYRDRAFVVCTSEDKSDNSLSQSIIGYSKADGHFTYYNYSSLGTSRSETGFPHGNSGLVYTSERRGRDGLVRSSTFVTPEADGRVHFRQQRSVNGGAWSESADFHYIARAARP